MVLTEVAALVLIFYSIYQGLYRFDPEAFKFFYASIGFALVGFAGLFTIRGEKGATK